MARGGLSGQSKRRGRSAALAKRKGGGKRGAAAPGKRRKRAKTDLSSVRYVLAYPGGTYSVVRADRLFRKANPAKRRPAWMAARPARWVPLVVGTTPTGRAYHPELASLKGKSGVYALRDKRTKGVVYVGESHTGRLYGTLLRHFQDPSGKFAKVGEWVHAAPGHLEVAWWVTQADVAVRREAEAIDYFAPSGNLRVEEAPF